MLGSNPNGSIQQEITCRPQEGPGPDENGTAGAQVSRRQLIPSFHLPHTTRCSTCVSNYSSTAWAPRCAGRARSASSYRRHGGGDYIPAPAYDSATTTAKTSIASFENCAASPSGSIHSSCHFYYYPKITVDQSVGARLIIILFWYILLCRASNVFSLIPLLIRVTTFNAPGISIVILANSRSTWTKQPPWPSSSSSPPA
jgi:hypothetical protein